MKKSILLLLAPLLLIGCSKDKTIYRFAYLVNTAADTVRVDKMPVSGYWGGYPAIQLAPGDTVMIGNSMNGTDRKMSNMYLDLLNSSFLYVSFDSIYQVRHQSIYGSDIVLDSTVPMKYYPLDHPRNMANLDHYTQLVVEDKYNRSIHYFFTFTPADAADARL